MPPESPRGFLISKGHLSKSTLQLPRSFVARFGSTPHAKGRCLATLRAALLVPGLSPPPGLTLARVSAARAWRRRSGLASATDRA